ncbi:lytic transglycosylase domain-containing protein [Aurantimonas sp. A2-1-M11]|uniref:lytic transglycosylase domain-containing protein n=1 Tax=Aurantimonas sp. A2-1-M11 TaxID=3113712 RepID=UPI002F943554
MTAAPPNRLRNARLGAAVLVALVVWWPGMAAAEGSITLPALAFPPSPPAFAEPIDPSVPAPDTPLTAGGICQLIARNAAAVGMSPDFFARLIWKESRFDAGAVSPVGARGIAQFMPYTADERGLDDPNDPRQALHHSAMYLADLRAELGNWGLAAAAYNGGINRVKRWLASGGSLPFETEEYVNAITFRPADWFREEGRELEERPLDAERDFDESCARLPIMKTRAVFAAFDDVVESAPMRPWGVQVAGHAKQAVAMKMFRRVQSSFGAILKGRDPLVIRGRNAARQRIYAVRIGADTRGEANALCGRLRGAGGSCVVLKN